MLVIGSPRPLLRPTRRPLPAPRAGIDVQESVALTGKFLGLFVLFTSSMNWWTFRRVRKENEKKK